LATGGKGFEYFAVSLFSVRATDMKKIHLLTCLFFALKISAQTCTAPGQNPSTAFPVCGTSTFSQTSVPQCGGRPMPFKGCPGDGLTDINPFWYKFTCFQSGTLGFLITPNDLGDDYDWEIYDITNRQPDDVYADGNLVIANNWSGDGGLTGASSAGTLQFVCGGYGKPRFSKMPSLIFGHNYLLLVSHFTQSQSGYKLAFNGGTAIITDPADPSLKKVEASCGGDVLRLKISKNIKCNSITPGGSEFYISPAAATVASATGINCSTKFDTDSIQLQLSTFLPPGNYFLHARKGSDGNTLLDYCDHPIAETDSIPFILLPKAPTPMDSMVPPTCAPKNIKLVFKKAMLCSSIDPAGTDFKITGNYPVTIVGASGNCSNGTTKEITVTFSSPMQVGGSFNIVLQKGIDGNTLLDECGEETPVGSNLPFVLQDTVNADFTYTIGYGCVKDSVHYFHPPGNGVNNWQWDLDENQQSSLQNPTGYYSVFNANKKVELKVTNGFCADTSRQSITLINYLKADFSVLPDNCPQELIPFTNGSAGMIKNYFWEFGDGTFSDSINPKHIYTVPSRETAYDVRLTVTDSFGCKSVAIRKTTIYSSCYIAVPNAFTPNNDGLNDLFHVLNAVKAINVEFIVFNRWGEVVFKTTDWKKGWDGKLSGHLSGSGVYVWYLRYTDRDTLKKREQKGTVLLIR
jgi:gliding motility-associated-like protein